MSGLWKRSAQVMGLLPFVVGCSIAYAGWESEIPANNPDDKLCQALLKRLNSFSEACSPDAVETYPGFRSPPWQLIDPKEHIDLVAKLNLYSARGPTLFATGEPLKFLDGARKGALDSIEKGATLQVWRTRLLSNFADSGDTRPAPPGDQTVVLLTQRMGTLYPNAECPGGVTKGWLRWTSIVSPDLSGPDTRLGDGLASLLRDHFPVLYGDRVLFIGGAWEMPDGKTIRSGSATIFQKVEPTGVMAPVCDFTFKRSKLSSRKRG